MKKKYFLSKEVKHDKPADHFKSRKKVLFSKLQAKSVFTKILVLRINQNKVFLPSLSQKINSKVLVKRSNVKSRSFFASIYNTCYSIMPGLQFTQKKKLSKVLSLRNNNTLYTFFIRDFINTILAFMFPRRKYKLKSNPLANFLKKNLHAGRTVVCADSYLYSIFNIITKFTCIKKTYFNMRLFSNKLVFKKRKIKFMNFFFYTYSFWVKSRFKNNFFYKKNYF